MASDTTDRQLVWVVLAIVAAFLVLAPLIMGFAMMGMAPMMAGAWDHGMVGAGDGATGWMLVVGVGLQLLFLVLLMGAGYLGYRVLTTHSGSTDPALAELRSAYARGDIDDEEFERRRERLEWER